MPDFHLTTTYSLFFIILAGVLAGILAVYGYRYTLPPVSRFLRISLLLLRGLGLFLLVLLLGEPLLSLVAHRSEKPVLAVLIDQSKSLTIRDKSGDRKETMLKALHAPVFDEM